MISVRDLIAAALPTGTRVVAGEAGLGREVTWATRLRPAPPAFGHLNGGELVLLPTNVTELLDERLTLPEVVRQLAGFTIAAIAHAGHVPAAARTAANETGIPLLQLPARTDLGSLERETSRFITERRRDVQRRGQEVGRQLMELAIAGEPLPATIRALADLAGRAVALEARDGRLLAYHVPPGRRPARTVAEPLLGAGVPTIAPWLRAMAATSPAEPPTASYQLVDGWTRVVAPVSGRDGLLGCLSLILPAGQETPEDSLLAARGAAACAVVLAREHAAASARREIELNVLDEVLDGALRSEISLLQQARRLGHDLTAPHVTLIARLDSAAGTPARAQDGRWALLDETLARASVSRDSRPLWRLRNNTVEIVWPVPPSADVGRLAHDMHRDLVDAIQTAARKEVVSLGIGRPGAGLDGIRQSHQEARQALNLGRRLHGPGHLTRFDDLGIYRLIFASEALPELRAFHDDALAAVLAYDQQHGADLIRTLTAFFAANCGPKEAAGRLHVHRNTVLYRLDRIRAITGLDLDDAAVRLRLHLALHVHVALFSGG